MRTPTRKECYEKISYILIHNSKKGWNGYNAEPVNSKSAVNTMLFLSELPKDIENPLPIFMPINENIHLTWQTSPAYWTKHKLWMFISAPISANQQTITIEGTAFGEHKKLIGTSHDFSNGIPKEVLDLLREITDINSKY